MKTRVQLYVEGVRAALRAEPGFPAKVEDSPVRAHTFVQDRVITVQPGSETVTEGATPRVNRVREIHLLVHTAGDNGLELSESIFAAVHPIVMNFSAPGLVQVQELRTDEPRYANGDLERQVITKRYLFYYQTADDSLSE
ncbi:MAG TPA: hypothetical protein DD803_15995 [Alcaligenes faecalis]|nr:hypothetical protein [Alcaligenes faecalis]HBQ90938.1 hypothetical protein [Alcaligenes faecalis]